RVRMGRASRVLASRVIDRIVTEKQAVQPGKDQVIVSVKLGTEFDVLVNALSCFLQGALCHRSSNGATAALSHSEYGGLANGTTPHAELFVLVFVGFFTTNKTLIQFNDALEFSQFRSTTSLSQTMEHEPCGRLPDADLLRQLHRRDALPSGHE